MNKADNRTDEQHRVDNVIHEINCKAEKLYSRASGLKESVIELRKNFWEDVTINLDEPDDVIETQASIKQQAELLSQKENIHGKVDEELKTLKKLKNSPYFGRIDFTEDTEDEAEQIYIGISSLTDRNEEDFLIYDWRAPISSLYYDYSPGEAAYETVEGTITGDISLKRQFIIKQGVIKGMFDTGVTIGDRLLQQALGNNASTKMKSIVATIQEEQNKIIRNKGNKILVVQGVAGSGKTSAALQRIAYLMYQYRDILNANNIVLLSPNPLFTSYIANVLPELGETNVRQSTFLDYLKSGIGNKLKIESPFEQMEYLLTGSIDGEYAIRMKNIEFKSSLEFKYLIDTFMSYLNKQDIQFKNVAFQKQILISKKQISDYFYSLDDGIAIPNKMELVSKWLLKKIRQQQKHEKNKDWVMEKIELLDKEEYLKAFYESQSWTDYGENESSIEEDILRREIVKRAFSNIKKKIRRFEFVNVFATYQILFSEWTPEETPDDWEEICEQTAANLSSKLVTWEDAAPYLYFQGLLTGDHYDRAVRHLVIDEAQDYTAFQFAYIQHLFPYARMTLLGDINQAIYTYTAKKNPLMLGKQQETYEKITLTKSYRSTQQIVEFTKHFAPGGEVIEPFNRKGTVPKLIRLNRQADLAETIITCANDLKENGHQTIGIICKTSHESDMIFNLLKDKLTLKQIDEETYSFQKGLLVLPVYLAKGIEVDTVIIPDASEMQYASESNRTLFYTACTRAMHELMMITASEPSPFIKEAPQDKYTLETR